MPHATAAATPSATHPLRRVKPDTLLSPARLDIVIKHSYFTSLLRPGMDEAAVGLYDQHITQRTGGLEDEKRRTEDYHDAARALLASLQRDGFDPRHPVPIGTNGLPRNGAHRIAACLALNLPLVVRDEPDPGPEWGFEWFRTREFTREQLDHLVRSYARLSPRVVAFVFWGPSFVHWPVMMTRLRHHARVVGWRDLQMHPEDTRSFVRDLYAWRLGPTPNDRIEDKARQLAADAPDLRVVLVDAPSSVDASDLEGWASRVKADLRRIAGRDAGDFFATVHASDSVDEARYVVDLAFNENSLRQLATRRGREDRPQFLEWLARYRATLARHAITLDDACIVGSAVLEAIGLRDATDIDCVITTHAREPRFHGGVVALGEAVDLVSAGYHRRHDGGPVIDDSRLAADPQHHFLFRGLKFANPEIVIDRKRQHARPKDIADVALWDQRPLNLSAPRPLVVCWATTSDRVVRSRLAASYELVLVGPAVVHGGPVHGITTPPAPDQLPDCLLTDPAPVATLKRFGVDASALHAIESHRSGAPEHSSHAFRRLRAFSWTVRWMDRWLRDLHPVAVLLPETDATTEVHLLSRVAASHSIPVVTAVDEVMVVPMGRAEDLVLAPAAVRGVCREANEVVPLIRDASATGAARRNAVVLRAEIQDLASRLDVAERCLTTARIDIAVFRAARDGREVVVWGAGSAGLTTLQRARDLGLTIEKVVDGSPDRWGSTIAGVPVVSPDALSRPGESGSRPAMIVASMYHAAISAQLRDMGFGPADIIATA